MGRIVGEPGVQPGWGGERGVNSRQPRPPRGAAGPAAPAPWPPRTGGWPSSSSGTSLLIIVVVTMDFMAQVQAYVMSHQYESLLKKANFKGGVFPTR